MHLYVADFGTMRYPGKNGALYMGRCGVCLEPMYISDCVHSGLGPSPILLPSVTRAVKYQIYLCVGNERAGGNNLIITADWLIPGDGRTVLERQAVALSEKDGQILEYGPVDALERKYGEKATTDYGGCTVLPGLIDLHVHISAWGDMPFGYAGSDFVHAYITLRNARKAFESGVTTLRSVADKNKLVASLVLGGRSPSAG